MSFLIIAIVLVFLLILIKTIYKINIKELKKIGEDNKELDEIVKKYPSNVEICKTILKKLNNENVTIQEEKDNESCLYIAITNKIIIANMRESFTRIQTIAHECLHSIQDKTILMFNFIFSNLYIAYFYIIALLGIFRVIPKPMIFYIIYIIFGYIYYFVRSYLEMDAMTKARFLAKEYMEEANISSKEEINKIVNEYDKLNNIGIKTVNFKLFTYTIIRSIVLAVIFGIWEIIKINS